MGSPDNKTLIIKPIGTNASLEINYKLVFLYHVVTVQVIFSTGASNDRLDTIITPKFFTSAHNKTERSSRDFLHTTAWVPVPTTRSMLLHIQCLMSFTQS